MNAFDVGRIIQWAIKFARNSPSDLYELTPAQLRQAVKDCQSGYDPYESAAEIAEGRSH